MTDTTAPMKSSDNLDLLVNVDKGILTVTFNRPDQRNAMTWEMYEALQEACLATKDSAIRAMVLRGAGDRAFVAGTDIAQFTDFDGDRGNKYERQVAAILGTLRAVDVPVIASVQGYCVGGGLGIAACADVRVCSPESKFGVPIARTLGNCLSADTLGLLIELLGRARTVDMLLQARFLSADEVAESGFVSEITTDPDTTAQQIAERVLDYAPLTMWSVKETVRRLGTASREVEDSDIVHRIYDSEDFHGAVRSFLSKTPYTWTGR